MCRISALLADFHFHQLLTAVISCWQLMTAVTKKIKWYFYLLPKCDVSAKFELWSLLGGPARECDIHTHAQTDAQTDIQTPGEYWANSGPASLVPGPELSNYYRNWLRNSKPNCMPKIGLIGWVWNYALLPRSI